MSGPTTTAELAETIDRFTAEYRCNYAHGPHGGIDCCMGTGWLVGSKAELDLMDALDLSARLLRESGEDQAPSPEGEVPF